jgi:hypothetical protein
MSTLIRRLFPDGVREPVEALEEVESRLDALPIRHPARVAAVGPGVARAHEQVPDLCRTLDDAVAALRTGRDRAGNPIAAAQVGAGLQHLVDGTSGPGVARLMGAALDDAGVQEFEELLDALRDIAAALRRS